MKMTHVGSLCVAVIAAFAGGLAQPANAAEVRPAIEAANARFSAIAAKRDAAGLAMLYATDGQLLPAGSDVVRGREEIQKFWQGALDSGIAGIELKTLEVFAAGSTANCATRRAKCWTTESTSSSGGTRGITCGCCATCSLRTQRLPRNRANESA